MFKLPAGTRPTKSGFITPSRKLEKTSRLTQKTYLIEEKLWITATKRKVFLQLING
jgi:hypothetical protein